MDALPAGSSGKVGHGIRTVPLNRVYGGGVGRRVAQLLMEFCGLPGTGKSTLARTIAVELHSPLLRIDEIESSMWRGGLPRDLTGIAAYVLAHDLAVGFLRSGLPVVVDAVSPVADARVNWSHAAALTSARHRVVETVCLDLAEHRRRVEGRPNDMPGFVLPTWEQVQRQRQEYEPRTDHPLVVDTTQPESACLELIRAVL